MKNLLHKIRAFVPQRQAKIFKKSITNPARDWSFVLFLMLLVALAAGLFSYYSFLSYYSIDQQSVAVSVDTMHYQGSQIREQVAEFAAMADVYQARTSVDMPTATTTPPVPENVVSAATSTEEQTTESAVMQATF